jgi:iron complex transport system ATP-binding protein
VLLDEATASLDVAAQHEVMELIAEIQATKGVTILSAIHDLTAASQFCDDLVLLDQGQTVATGPPSAVLTEDILATVFEPTIRVIEVEGNLVVVSLRTEGNLT